ncbi:YgaP family membrane protein [Rhizobium sp. LjRoot254]|uniref:YgaP family membrane protein n=1 Tax=Rhizobium sp. LjRoot254 TaxID=3342297 RepID=UPI003ECE81EB
MFYRKNVGEREQVARLVGGAVMLLSGLLLLPGQLTGYMIAAAGVMTMATGLVGFCPACALRGRKLKVSGRESGDTG